MFHSKVFSSCLHEMVMTSLIKGGVTSRRKLYRLILKNSEYCCSQVFWQMLLSCTFIISPEDKCEVQYLQKFPLEILFWCVHNFPKHWSFKLKFTACILHKGICKFFFFFFKGCFVFFLTCGNMAKKKSLVILAGEKRIWLGKRLKTNGWSLKIFSKQNNG